MVILDGSTERFYRVGEAMQDVPHHGQAALFPSELMTIGLCYAIEGGGRFTSHPGCLLAAFDLLVQWNGLKPARHGVVRHSIAQFSL